MIDLAKKYEYELIKRYRDVLLSDRLFWFHERPYIKYDLEIMNDSWNHLQFVSIDQNGKVSGFLSGQLDRINNQVNNLLLLNFEKPSMQFTIDCLRFVDQLKNMGFVKIMFSVVVGNPAEKIYDAILEKLGGSHVGTFRKDVKLPDGNYYDRKFYEILL